MVAWHTMSVVYSISRTFSASRESLVDVTLEYPTGAGRGVFGFLRKLREQVV